MKTLGIVSAVVLLFATGAFSTPFPGPDAAGYWGKGISTNLRDISLTGTQIAFTPDGDEGMSGVIGIGFSFDFYGSTYTDVYVSSNGFLTFLPGQVPGFGGSPIPTPGNPDGLVAGLWSDLDTDAGPGSPAVYYETQGSEFIVGFYGVSHWLVDPVTSNTFEIILHQGTNKIELQYGAVADPLDSRSHAAGIENQDGSIGLEVYFGGAPDGPLSDQGFLITPVPEPATIGLVTLGLAGLLAWRRRR